MRHTFLQLIVEMFVGIRRRWGWTSSLGAPAALVAGAVLVTLGETRQDLAPKRGDKKWIRVTKMLIRFLLLSSFAMEVLSIFVSTVTGEY